MILYLALSIVALVSTAILSYQFWMGSLLGGCPCAMCARARRMRKELRR